MKWRVIIRVSFDGQGPLRNQIAGLLTKCGVHNTGTGMWETDAGAPLEIAQQLQEILLILAESTEAQTGDEAVSLDHIWIYIDKGPRPEKNRNKFELILPT